jgi:hypothetical protein
MTLGEIVKAMLWGRHMEAHPGAAAVFQAPSFDSSFVDTAGLPIDGDESCDRLQAPADQRVAAARLRVAALTMSPEAPAVRAVPRNLRRENGIGKPFLTHRYIE